MLKYFVLYKNISTFATPKDNNGAPMENGSLERKVH